MLDELSPAVANAWRESLLRQVAQPSVDRLLAGAREVRFRPNEVVMHGRASELRLILIVSGLVRTFMRAADGRQATLGYLSDGDIVGLPVALAAGPRPVAAEALTDVHGLSISARGFVDVIEADHGLALATGRYMARQLFELMEMLATDIFLPVPARVARHLLDLAQRDQGQLTVQASNQQIADAIGSVRDVVSRAIGQLAALELVERRDGALWLVDPSGLHRLARGAGPLNTACVE